jgi:hypothetical protein
MARGRADIANTALRIFLQEMGAAYDQERGLVPYGGPTDFATVKGFFGGRCCYCDIELTGNSPAQDHLIPMNKTSLGLHAWGNVVPACGSCNAKKQGGDWRDFVIQRRALMPQSGIQGFMLTSMNTVTHHHATFAGWPKNCTRRSAVLP